MKHLLLGLACLLAAGPPADAAPANRHTFRLEFSRESLARASFSLAVGPDGALIARTRLFPGTPTSTCVTIAPAVRPDCTGAALRTPIVAAGDFLAIEGAAASLLDPGGASVALAWTQGAQSGTHVLTCTWVPFGGVAGLVVNGECLDNAALVPPGGAASGVVTGHQDSCDCVFAPQYGVLSHLAVVL